MNVLPRVRVTERRALALYPHLCAVSGPQLARALELLEPQGVILARTLTRKGLLARAAGEAGVAYHLAPLGQLLTRGAAAGKTIRPPHTSARSAGAV